MFSADFSTAKWRKSRRSGGNGGECVEIAQMSAVVGVRDSKDPDAGVLAVESEQFAAFLTAVKAGQLR